MLGGGQVGIRDKQFKTILYHNDAAKIYDLKNDPLEMQNLADTERGKAVKQRHMDYMRQYISRIEPAPVPAGDKVEIKHANIYEKYNSWYKRILKEA
jgi:arylsulfatase A-like enzyme